MQAQLWTTFFITGFTLIVLLLFAYLHFLRYSEETVYHNQGIRRQFSVHLQYLFLERQKNRSAGLNQSDFQRAMLRKATVRRQGNPRGAGRTPTSFFPQQPTWLSRVRHKDEVCPCSVSCSGYRAPSCPPSSVGNTWTWHQPGELKPCAVCVMERVSASLALGKQSESHLAHKTPSFLSLLQVLPFS